MNDQSRRAEPQDPRVEAALRDYLERVDRGEPVDREEFLARHAPIADQLRSFIAAEDEVRKLAGAGNPLDYSHDSTKSFAIHGQETVVPQSAGKWNAESGGSGLTGRFGRYRIIRALGMGAMGTVYLAEDTQLERQIALKTPHFTEDPTGEQLERFFREARAAGTLRHPHICPIHDFGQIDGKHFITMAYIEGHPLSAFSQAAKPQTERQVLLLVRKLALALQEAHDHGVVHRDLKPANIMVDKNSEPIIMDFGLAQQARREGDIRLTQTGNIIGTPAYMSPEQVEGKPDKIGPATDQYSLGVILYELLTGELPFRGSIVAVMGQVLTQEPTSPSQLRPDLDPRIEAVCLKMLAKNTPDRFPSLSAVADEFATILKSPAAKATSKGKHASSPAGDRRRADGGASQVLKSLKPKAVTASDLAALEELARKCLARHDDEQVIQIVERIPEDRRSAGLQTLLEKARDRADAVAFLICEIDDAVRLNDERTAMRKAEELLKIKPGHHRARNLEQEFASRRKTDPARIGPLWQFTRPWSEGGWIPWSALAFGLAVFGVMTFGITIYLRSGKAVVKVEINDPSVEVTVKGRTAVLKAPGQEIEVEPGENELTITLANLRFTTKSFTLKKGQNKAVTVELVDSKLAAKFGDEILEERPVAPLPRERAGTDAETTLATTAHPAPLIAPFDQSDARAARAAWARSYHVGEETTNALGMKLALIPAGTFHMGAPRSDTEPSSRDDERPQHRVQITQPFYLGICEVTQQEFERVTGRNPSLFRRGPEDMNADTRRFPVETVSWFDAVDFCNQLSQIEGRQPYYAISGIERKDDGSIRAATVTIAGGNGDRLPTEAQWEYACRAGTTTPFSFGRTNNAHEANVDGENPYGTEDKGPLVRRPVEVGSYPANAFDLQDMHGNVWEWCQDWYDDAYYARSPTDDPQGPETGERRVERGGCYMSHGEFSRSSTRSNDRPDLRAGGTGFRVALPVRGGDVANVGASSRPSGDKPKALAARTEDRPAMLSSPFDGTTAKNAQQRWAEYLTTSTEVTNSIGMKLRLIPAGEFLMGSPESENDRSDNERQHSVKVTNSFYLGMYEVTQEEFERVAKRSPSLFVRGGRPNDEIPRIESSKFPVETVSWYDTIEFCNLLSQQEGLHPRYRISDVERNLDGSIRNATVSMEKGRGYRLPTEAEWEYACRAGTTTPFHFGLVNNGQDSNVDASHPYGTAAQGPYFRRPTTVGQYQANAFGLYDMHGNVWEWCQDWYDETFYERSPPTDPQGPATGTFRVNRGGCWSSFAEFSRSAKRMFDAPDRREGGIGFRVARDLPQAESIPK